MKIVDLNVLLYTVNSSFEQHDKILRWWTQNLVNDDPIGLTWVVLMGFMRISTNPRVFPNPLSTETALEKIETWLMHPNTCIVQASHDHFRILRELLENCGSAGNLTTDAHLAAIAIGNGASMVSCDNDFSRFNKLRWSNPLHS